MNHVSGHSGPFCTAVFGKILFGPIGCFLAAVPKVALERSCATVQCPVPIINAQFQKENTNEFCIQHPCTGSRGRRWGVLAG